MTEPSALSETAFDMQAVSFAYRDVPALKHLSLHIHKGERVALMGANGSGKSTILRLLAGLAFPDSGQISFFGEAMTEQIFRGENFFFNFRRQVGVVFQNSDMQLFCPSVFDEVAFGPLQLRWPRDQIRFVVERTLDAMGIRDLRNRAPHRLSGGEKKRVALASVLVLDPEVLLLDEPTAGLDPNSQAQITELLASWANGAKTVITATHDLESLEEIADRCYVLKAGCVEAEGAPLALLHELPLLTSTGLIRPQHHQHGTDTAHPHPHVHVADM